MAERHFDGVVIGGGPAGYVGAIRAAQLGFRVACVERDKLGGVCLNWGCIPSKALLSSAELFERVSTQGELLGLKVRGVEQDWSRVISRSRDIAARVNKGVHFLFTKNKIEHIEGSAKIVAGAAGGKPCRVEIRDANVLAERTDAPAEIAGKVRETITASHLLVATGSVARDLPFARFDGERVWGAREAMFNDARPARLVVVGAGAIGMEFAYLYHTFGTKVTVVEMMDRILPAEDDDVSRALDKLYRKAGMDIRTSHTVTGVETTKAGVKVAIAPAPRDGGKPGTAETIEADRVLLAIGVKGRYDGLFDESLGLRTVKDHIRTDYVPIGAPEAPMEPAHLDYATSLPGVYAVGDVIGPPWLAHVGSDEATLCVERLAWRAGKLDHEPIPIDYTCIPGCTYCHPQVASVGFTERALAARGMKKGEDFAVGVHQFHAHGKAIAAAANHGFVKIIRGLPRGEILGAHVIGDQATELIGELALARRLEATTEEIIATTHAHPTMYEALREAALAAESRPINA